MTTFDFERLLNNETNATWHPPKIYLAYAVRLIEEHDISLLLRNCEFSRSVGLAFYKVYWWEYDAAADDDDDNDNENVLNTEQISHILCVLLIVLLTIRLLKLQLVPPQL